MSTTERRAGGDDHSPEAVVRDLKALLSASIAGNVELASRINDLVRETIRTMGERGTAPTDPQELLGRWLDFNLASYSVVSRHSLEMMDGLVSAAETALLGEGRVSPAGQRRSAAGRRAPADRTVELRVSGRVGGRVEAPFLVENTYDHPVDVELRAGALEADGGGSVGASRLRFVPDGGRLAPRAHAVFQAVIDLDDGFQPGETYRTTIRVLGFEARSVDLVLTVLPEGGGTSEDEGKTEEDEKPRAGGSDGAREKKPRARKTKKTKKTTEADGESPEG